MTDEAASGARAAGAREPDAVAAGRERDPVAAGRELDPVAEAWAARPSTTQDLPSRADLVVVGGGLMGTATAWAAARRGLSVILLEQFELGHSKGSSHGSARILRRAYLDPLYVRLTGEAMPLWRELEADSGRDLLRITGGIDHGRRRDPEGIARVLDAAGVEHELLDAGSAAARWPGMVFDGPVLFHPQAGTVDAALTVLAATEVAERQGAVVLANTTVLRLDVTDDDVRVVTAAGAVRARRVVVAAGAWAGELLDGVVPMPRLTVSQQQVFHFPHRDETPNWPVTVHDQDLVAYHLPGARDAGPRGGRKVAEHMAPNAETTADGRSGVVDPAARARLVAHVQRWLPGLAPEPYAETTCLYTSTSNEDFVLDRVGPVVACSPCSGHGAKFAPLIGRMAVDLATGDAAPEPRFRFRAHAQGAATDR
ncbi:MAG TPA: FAD-dependent oxidoreductase [Actinomycetales bacterium]|nr:FAD-dependent oxidoreductase [Actinomycetales bacterium]